MDADAWCRALCTQAWPSKADTLCLSPCSPCWQSDVTSTGRPVLPERSPVHAGGSSSCSCPCSFEREFSPCVSLQTATGSLLATRPVAVYLSPERLLRGASNNTQGRPIHLQARRAKPACSATGVLGHRLSRRCTARVAWTAAFVRGKVGLDGDLLLLPPKRAADSQNGWLVHFVVAPGGAGSA